MLFRLFIPFLLLNNNVFSLLFRSKYFLIFVMTSFIIELVRSRYFNLQM